MVESGVFHCRYIIKHDINSLRWYFFRAVHSVCLWDDKGPTKVYQALQDDILNFISNAQTVSISVKTNAVLEISNCPLAQHKLNLLGAS